jgi:hypothetical protein
MSPPNIARNGVTMIVASLPSAADAIAGMAAGAAASIIADTRLEWIIIE